MAKQEGRPTLYKPEMDATVKEYFDRIMKERKDIPFIEEVALMLDIDIDTLESWVNGEVKAVSSQFIGTIKKIKALQKIMLMSKSLGTAWNRGNITMAIFLLKANHGMKETSVKELTGKDGQPLAEALKGPQQINSLLDAIEQIAETIENEDVSESTS